jgi:Arc/MetJ-type ribon-helix-helix transcriptional regulator
MKVSVSLPQEDVDFLDDYVHRRGGPSRSAVLHHAIDLLRRNDLEDAYADAWAEWAQGEQSADAADGEPVESWDEAVADALADAPR